MSWTDEITEAAISFFNSGLSYGKIAEKLCAQYGSGFTRNSVCGKIDREFRRDPSRFTRQCGRIKPDLDARSSRYDALPDSTILALLQARDDGYLPATAPRYAMTSQKAHAICRTIDVALAESEAA